MNEIEIRPRYVAGIQMGHDIMTRPLITSLVTVITFGLCWYAAYGFLSGSN